MYVQDIGGWGTVGNRRGNAFKKKKRPGEDLVASPFKKSKTHGNIHVQMVCVLCLYPSKVHSRKKNKKKKLCFFLLYVKTPDHFIYVLFIARLLFLSYFKKKLVCVPIPGCRIKATKAKLTCHDLSSSSAVVQLGHGEKEKNQTKNKQSRMDYLSECWPTRVTTAYNPSLYKCG